MGNPIKANVIHATNKFVCEVAPNCWKNEPKIDNENNPKTTDGIPANNWIIWINRFLIAGLRKKQIYKEAKIVNGTAKDNEKSKIKKEPIIKRQIPNCWVEGDHWLLKKPKKEVLWKK